MGFPPQAAPRQAAIRTTSENQLGTNDWWTMGPGPLCSKRALLLTLDLARQSAKGPASILNATWFRGGRDRKPRKVQGLSGRSRRESSHRHKAIRASNLDRGVVGTELGNVTETGPVEAGPPARRASSTASRTGSRSSALLTIVDEGMPFGQHELPVVSIELSEARKRQLAPIGLDTFSEERLLILALR